MKPFNPSVGNLNAWPLAGGGALNAHPPTHAARGILVAVLGLAAVGVASAQSSVTLFGVVDAAISGYKSQSVTPSGISVNTSKTALSSGGYNTSRLGFRGTEDLGGGLAASFWLESGVQVDTGAGAASDGGLNYNRRSTVSLSGGFGEVRLGRDYTPTLWNDNVFDPFGNNGVGASLIYTANAGTAFGVPNSGFRANANYLRASNSVGYFLPRDLGGFYGQVMFAMNERTNWEPAGLTPATNGAVPGLTATLNNAALLAGTDPAGTTRAGQYVGGRFGYAKGPLDVALAYAQSTIASNFYAGSTTALHIWNLGASYDFGVVKLFGEYSNNKQKTDLANNILNPFGVTKPGANGGLLGVTVPVGPGLIRAAYSAVRYNNVLPASLANSAQPKADQFAIGYVYNLSRRTALYATGSYISNDNGAALSISSVGAPTFYTGQVPGGGGAPVPSKSMGYDFGIRHVF